MDNKLSFNFCTAPAGKRCMITSVREAVKCFANINKKGYVTLETVTTPSEKQIIVWVCRNNGRAVALLPVFRGKTVTQEMVMLPMQLIKQGELFCSDGYYYRTFTDDKGDCIRAVKIFDSEEEVRKACVLSGLKIISVELVQLRNADTREYITSVWSIKSTDPNLQTVVCVDLSEHAMVRKLDFANVVQTTVQPGSYFLANGVWYELHRDDVDSLYITKSNMQMDRKRV